MRLAIAVMCLAMVSCQAVQSPPTVASSKDNRISLYLGQRSLDKDDWSPVEDQATLGLEYVREKQGDPIGFEVGLMGSSDDSEVAGTDLTGSTGELYAGIRKTFGEGVVRPYVGVGLSYIDAEIKADGFNSEDDASLAGYVHGGIDFDVTDSFFVGVDLRALFGSDLTIAGFDTDADYFQFALGLGFAF